MNRFNQSLTRTAIVLLVIAGAGHAQSRTFAAPHVLEASSTTPVVDTATVCAPRDMATGQASGKRQHGAIPRSMSGAASDGQPAACSPAADASQQSVRESPTKASTGRESSAPSVSERHKELTGHVTLMK